MNVLITGGNGYIAKSIFNNLKDKCKITAITRHDFDLVNYNDVYNWFSDKLFDVVIHTATIGGNRLYTDTKKIMHDNIIMYRNLYNNKHRFNKFISFGSGAEIFNEKSYYGVSKRTIADSISDTLNFYNLRIFGVFDENELSTRFIKSNICRYIKKEPMVIHTDKIMDFFYMKDLIKLVDYYIQTDQPPKQINCSYDKKYTLTNIANMINTLGNHTVPVIIENKNKLEFYCGESHYMPISTLGLETGIYTVYNKLCNGDLIHV